MNNYQRGKERARHEAVLYQISQQDPIYSLYELADCQEYFSDLAHRYGLVREFRENAII